VKGGSSNRRAKPQHVLVPLAVGFTAAALSVFAVVGLVGDRVRAGGPPGTGGAWVIISLLIVLLVGDLGLLGLSTPMWRRQTPRHHFVHRGPARGAFAWGLDTGLVFTTFRVTSLSWAGLLLTVAGVLPLWSGALYAIGFLVPLTIAVAVVPWKHHPLLSDGQEPSRVVRRLLAVQPSLKRAAAGSLAGVIVCIVVSRALGG
jgi:hypothetical protein